MNCIYRNSFFESETFHQLLSHALLCIQTPLYVFGAYIVIVNKTPSTMEKVKFPMLLMHFSCALFDSFMNILAIPIVIFPITCGYPLGLMYRLGVPTGLQTYLVLTSFFFLGPATVMFFENRYNHLVRTDSDSSSRKMRRMMHYFINYVFALISFIPPFFNTPTNQEARGIAREKVPCLPSELIDNPILFMLGSPRVVGYCTSIFIAITRFQILLFFSLTAFYLFDAKIQSERTSRLQKQFFKAICIQIALPFFIVTIPVSYLISTMFTGDLDLILSNLSVFWCTSHGLLSIVIMLRIHKPYRKATMEFLKIDKVEVNNPPRHLKLSRIYN
ncbi:hypothetical protein CAEBREN_13195 [Caenorhabditis brenneri]|uniref:Serpentine Receptor, class H n=1 Tax=Caenorhabditis brenneri TaxID=135651 RepID=G0NF43_CAEBE|nr:hypothetical protein CAEBREN_13195 [Caenorhabditis brenneri]